MNQDWILQRNETRRVFANSTWVPLRVSRSDERSGAGITEVGYVSEMFWLRIDNISNEVMRPTCESLGRNARVEWARPDWPYGWFQRAGLGARAQTVSLT